MQRLFTLIVAVLAACSSKSTPSSRHDPEPLARMPEEHRGSCRYQPEVGHWACIRLDCPVG
jgi:hypothetical protein